MINPSELKSGFHYFVMGWHLIARKGLKRYVILPIVLNTLLLAILFWLFIGQISGMIDSLMYYMPDWLGFLSVILMILAVLMILLVFYFIFTTLSGFIAAPFNGLLAEKTEKMLTGEAVNDDNFWDIMKDIPRMMKREWQKLWYSLPKIIGLFLLGFIPVIGQTLVPVLTFLFTAWMMAIQYCDYPFDNHKIPFDIMKTELGRHRTQHLTFGALVSSCAFLPVINVLIMPVAVCGATAMWVENYRSPLIFGNGFRPQTNQNGGNQIRPHSGNDIVQ